MNLWVRSQDKEKLLKCNDIAISNNVINERESIKFKGYKIVGYFDKNTEYEILGTYETKERAIEVLDEIQDKMLNSAFAKKINGLGEELDLIPNPILIYNMPEN